ncbi:MAG: DUF1559 domain-containing protein, partial [Planctomycetota bacterium]
MNRIFQGTSLRGNAAGQRDAFTLVELLVVIAIIGILMGLLIPAVGVAREQMRRTSCLNNIRSLAQAAQSYENRRGHFPGYLNDLGQHTSGINPADPSQMGIPAHKKLGSWAVALLGDLDLTQAYETFHEDQYPLIDSTGAWSDQAEGNQPIFRCPSNTAEQGNGALNSYAANNGMAWAALSQTIRNGFSFEDSQSRNNGIFNNKYKNSDGGAAIGPDVRSGDIKDGQDQTVMFFENTQARPWIEPALLATTPGELLTEGGA